MGLSGELGSVMTMPLELAATALSNRRRISSEAGRPELRSYGVREECVSNTRILQPHESTGYAASPNAADVKGSPFRGTYSEENWQNHERRTQKNGLRTAATALRLRRPGAHHRRADHAPPPRKAPQHLRDEPERGPGPAPRGRPRHPRGAPGQHRLHPRGHPQGREEQRRR